MSYRIEAHETLPEGIKRIALEQIDQALEQLTDRPEGRDEAVHDARKRFKKVRAVLRLVRDEIGEDVYQAENRCFRDAGRRLSAVRDSAVLIETLDYMADHAANGQLSADLVTRVRHRLVYAHEYLSERILESESALAIVIDMITRARARVAGWPIEHDDFSALADGLHRVYKRGRKRFADAMDEPSTAHLHEWRKRVKYLWYHTRILKPLWPPVLDELADELHDLSDVLGLDHDLAVFLDKVIDLPEMAEDGNAELFAELIGHRRADLQASVEPLAARIYADKPKTFITRFASYWDAWRLENTLE